MFNAIAVVGGHANCSPHGCTPCGVCRQMLCEQGGKDMLVITYDDDMKISVRRIEKLLPYAFSANNVNKR